MTPGMNDHGLGPAATETVFGHGGADEGFRADLTVWKERPNAVVLMVNSDNGSIISEVMLAIAKEPLSRDKLAAGLFQSQQYMEEGEAKGAVRKSLPKNEFIRFSTF